MNSERIVFVTEPFRFLFSYRARLSEGVLQDLKQQYSGSVLGLFWVLLYPLLQLAIYCTLYVFIFKVRPAGLTQWSYVVLVFSGLVPILAFNQALQMSISSLSSNKALLSSTVFPPLLINIRSMLVAQFPMLFGMAITIVMALAIGRTNIWLLILYVPILWIFLLAFVSGLGWILSLVTLIARDVQHSIGLILMLMTFLSPFAFTPDMVPAPLKIILYINPLTYFVRAFQDVICYGQHPELLHLGVSCLLGWGTFYLGYWMFEKTKHTFFDYV